MAQQNREPVPALRRKLTEDGTLDRLASHIQTEKTLNFLFEKAVKTVPEPEAETGEKSAGVSAVTGGRASDKPPRPLRSRTSQMGHVHLAMGAVALEARLESAVQRDDGKHGDSGRENRVGSEDRQVYGANSARMIEGHEARLKVIKPDN